VVKKWKIDNHAVNAERFIVTEVNVVLEDMLDLLAIQVLRVLLVLLALLGVLENVVQGDLWV